MFHWYALHTKPNAERRVVLQLRQRDIEAYLPQYKKTLANQQQRMVPFFPGYLFASLDLDQGDSGWQWTPGLRYVVAYGEEPIPVPKEMLAFIKRRLKDLDNKASGHGFKPGDVVRIKQGPFEDMEAVFEGPTTPSERVQILLNTLNHSIRVRLSAGDLQKIEPSRTGSQLKRPRRTRGRGRRIN